MITDFFLNHNYFTKKKLLLKKKPKNIDVGKCNPEEDNILLKEQYWGSRVCYLMDTQKKKKDPHKVEDLNQDLYTEKGHLIVLNCQ